MGLGLDVATGGIPFWVLYARFTDDAEIRSTSTVVPLGSTLLATAAIPMGPRNKALAPCPSSVRHGSDLESPLAAKADLFPTRLETYERPHRGSDEREKSRPSRYCVGQRAGVQRGDSRQVGGRQHTFGR